MGVDIFGADFVGVDILGVDITAPTPQAAPLVHHVLQII